MTRLLTAAAAIALLTACNQASKDAASSPTDGNAALAEANSSGNAATAAVTNAIASSDATPLQKEQAIALVEERHANYGKIGKAMRAAKKAIDGNDVPAIRSAAATINDLAPKAASWFPAGTGADAVTLPGGHKIEAKADIWQQPEQFAAAMKNFQTAAANFNQLASSTTDVTAIKAAHANLGGTCKSCHEKFRAE